MKNHKTKIGVALAALLAIPALTFAQPGPGPGYGKRDPERAARRAAMIAQFDTSGDGVLDDAERAVAQDVIARQRFEEMDKNKDGFLSFDEFKAGRRMYGFRRPAPPAEAPAQK